MTKISVDGDSEDEDERGLTSGRRGKCPVCEAVLKAIEETAYREVVKPAKDLPVPDIPQVTTPQSTNLEVPSRDRSRRERDSNQRHPHHHHGPDLETARRQARENAGKRPNEDHRERPADEVVIEYEQQGKRSRGEKRKRSSKKK